MPAQRRGVPAARPFGTSARSGITFKLRTRLPCKENGRPRHR